MTTGFVDEPRLAGLMLRETARRLRSLLRAPGFAFAEPALVAAPADLRRGDASLARSFYVGHLWLAGQLVELDGRSPFTIRDVPRNWAVELHAFDWLRHFTEGDDALSSQHARALVADWLTLGRRRLPRLAFEHDTAARRVINWYGHWPIVLAQADDAFSRRFNRALDREVCRLRRTVLAAPDGLPRLRVRMAIAFAALAQPGRRCGVKVAARALADELERQIHPDGGHMSRSPAAIAAILADLLPLRQLFAQRNQPVPRGIFAAIDRMLPALRFFRHADGATALFNGAGVTDNHLLAALSRYDETLGEPISQMRQSGYQRMAAGRAVVIADTGLPPAPTVSGDAHAGTLAFEFSAGGRRLVVNCGAPQRHDAGWRRLSRTTAAHSTLTLNDHSSSRFSRSERLDRFLGGPLMPGPTRVPVNREEAPAGQTLTAAHDGYRRAFGFVHERQMTLSSDGRTLEGVDRLFRSTGRAQRLEAQEPMGAVRFHLHPDVEVEERGGAILLRAGEETWWFAAEVPPQIEDSIFFADGAGARRTRQIVLAFDCVEREEIAWRFRRAA